MRFIILFTLLFPLLTASCAHLSRSPLQVNIEDATTHETLTTPKFVIFPREITEKSAQKLVDDMFAVAPLPGPLVIIIDSLGGEVMAGYGILEVMSAFHQAGIPTVCVVTDEADSMAADILSHCAYRVGTEDATVMFHHVRSAFVKMMTAAELRMVADQMEEIEAPLTFVNLMTLNITPEVYEDACQKEKEWTAEELKKLGYINTLVTVSFTH